MTHPISWETLAAEPVGRIPFLIDPYIPAGGVILLYGKTRLGKSPLTWEIARCVGAGEPFFGRPTQQGTVLYFELDTPRQLVQARLEQLTPAPHVWWTFLPALNILEQSSQSYFRKLQESYKPALVIVNTLRATYSGDEKDAALPLRIYTTFQALFSHAAILFVHHDRKSSGDPKDSSDPDEAFSGHQAWFNHCQVGLHLVRHGAPHYGLVRLVHSKSQVSAQAAPLVLQLSANGSVLIDYSASQLKAILSIYQALEGPKSERVRLVARHLGLSERTIWAYLSRLPDLPLQS